MKSTKNTLCAVIRYSLFWLFGYAVTIGAKIVLSKVFVESMDGLEKVSYYTGKDSYDIWHRFLKAIFITRGVTWFSRAGRDLLFLAAIIVFIAMFMKKVNVRIIKLTYPILIIALYPPVWCFVCSSHSDYPWTVWNFSISMFVVFRIIYDILVTAGDDGFLQED